MKFIFLLFTGWLPGIPLLSQATHEQQMDNLMSFARLYGYVKYFHPSDEAAAMDWDKFAIYGSRQVMTAKNEEELLQKLKDLFCPMAPTIKLYATSAPLQFDPKAITPGDAGKYKTIAWQHFGVGLGNPGYIYRSSRSNRPLPAGQKQQTDFASLPAPGTTVQKDISTGIKVILPLSLYGNSEGTWPLADKTGLEALRAAVAAEKDSTGNELTVRLADVIIAWNVFKHFFAYWEDAAQDATTMLHNALSRAMTDANEAEFKATLQLMTAPLHDGHIAVWMPADTSRIYMVPVLLDWVENKLVVDKVWDNNLSSSLLPGDIITSVDTIETAAYIRNKEQYLSGSMQWKRSKTATSFSAGYRSTGINVTVQRNGISQKMFLKRTDSVRAFYRNLVNARRPAGFIRNGVFYLHLDSWPMDSIKKHLPDLEKSKGIICDLRGYPNSNHELIKYLLTEKEDTKWMFVPKLVYPDFEQVTYLDMGWQLRPAKPHLSAKVIFITDGRAISYAESYIGYIKDFKLATIVGQATAGANGNINMIHLPGNYVITFTGMLVKNHDGTKHHLTGIVPDIPVQRTIKGVAEGRDELLEKAIMLAEQ